MLERLAGLKVEFSPFLRRSTDAYWVRDERGDSLVMFNETALHHSLRGVRWHDEADHCPTWAGDRLCGDCRCDVEPPHA